MKSLMVLFFLILFSFTWAQPPGGGGGEKPEKPEKKVEKVEKGEKDAIEEYYDRIRERDSTPADDTGSGFWGPLIFLLLVVGVLYIILKFIRKKKAPSIADVDFMQSLATLSLGSGGFLEIVEIGEKIYLLGVGSHSVNLLLEIEDKELILTLKSRPTAPKHKTFLNVLGDIFEKKGKKIELESQKGFMHFLKEQRKRLKKLK